MIEEIDDPVRQTQEDIASFLAELSAESDVPKGFTGAPDQFEKGEVDFDSDVWLSYVIAVKEWFNFESSLSDSSIDEFLRSLATALEFDEADKAIDRSTSLPKLTPVALDRLRERAERAVQLQQQFVEDLRSDSGSLASASQAWEDGWTADEEIDPISPEPVIATANTWRIGEFVTYAEDSKLNLAPSYQRGDVWTQTPRQMLIESILRGIPLPSVILLKSSDQGAQAYEVVDGKQRLTSILRFIGKHPLAIARVARADAKQPEANLLHLFNTDYPKFKLVWKRVFNEPIGTTLEEDYYFPFKLRTDDRGLSGEELTPLRGKYYSQIKDQVISIANEQVPVREVFERSSEYRIPVIIYSRATQKQIHEVFNLYNKQGTHLNAEEIRNAIYHELEIVRASLVAAGDSNPRTPVGEIAPSLEPSWNLIEPLQGTLHGYGFSGSRYRRTKVLTWVIATLLFESTSERLPSTAKYIDSLFQRVQADLSDPLRSQAGVRAVFEWIAQSAEVHASITEAWAPEFKDGGSGAKWQELQLVGSLVGIAIAGAVLGDELENRVEEAAQDLYDASKTWERPKKTQTRQQWEFISHVARGVVNLLDVDAATASKALRDRFGSSGVEALWAVTGDDAS